MPQRIVLVTLALAAAGTGVLLGGAAGGPGKDRPAERKPSGLDQRVPWTTSKVRGSPDPPSPYRTELAFPKLKFDEPLDITNAPGTDRLFVLDFPGHRRSW